MVSGFAKFFNETNYKYMLAVILIVALFIRIGGINTILFFEEAQWGMFAEDHTFTNLGLTFNLKNAGSVIWPHNPLVPVLFKLATIQGFTTSAIRTIPLIFGMATIGLMFFMARRFYSTKTAVITSGLMAIGYWHMLASLVVDIDGAVLTFFAMLMSYFLLLYEDGHAKKYIILSGLAFGLSLHAKFAAFLILPVIFVYLIVRLKEHKITGALKTTLSILFLGLLVFSIFPISSFIIGQPEIFLNSFSHSGGYTSFEPTTRPIMVMFVFGTPLFILLSIAAIKNWRHSKNLFFLLFVFYFLLMYSLFLGSIGTESTYEKYLMITIPAMSLLAGDFISRVSFSKKLLGMLIVVSFAAMFLMNIPTADYIDHSVPEYQRRALSVLTSMDVGSLSEWNYNFPLMGNVQPGFWINFYSLAIMSIISGLLFISYVIKRSRLVFTIFLAVMISMNLFYIQEFIIHGTHPDINKPTYDMADFYNTNYPDRPLYTNAITLAFYTHKTDDYFVGSTDDTKDQALAAKAAGAVMLLTEYYPNIHKDSQAWKNINTCRLELEFSDKGFVVGRAFVC